MVRFIKKVFIGAIIPVVLLLVLNYLYINSAYYSNFNGVYKFNHIPYNIQIANFGNSHSLDGFDWSVCPDIRAANLAMGAQTLVFDNAIFTNYYDKFKEGSTIIIEISYSTLYIAEPSIAEGGSQITRYYQFLDSHNIPNYSFITALKYRYFPILTIRFNQVDDIFTYNPNSKPLIKKASDENVDILTNEGKARAQKFIKSIGSQELGIQYEALLKIIDKCKAKNMNIVLITMPTLECFYSEFSDSFYSRFYQDIDNIRTLYDKIYYIDYTGDTRFNALDLYANTDHLNADGALIFTRAFMQDISKMGITIG
ncbi:hypothetical protein [Acetanaerobacterium elongatum]|uniref:SGNH/GDSL hydrolase family protein n=1 Tax=Acetanaerobacterium elongatum TaxID=258515 RepID=A0A1G9Z5N9_9FIRM|nr:hypothetical protein [Acetanaerobacterium elongatum]SDN16574.1 hypothetical protein SAMN05192585_112100 [Acetanaerobacterium elongatum]